MSRDLYSAIKDNDEGVFKMPVYTGKRKSEQTYLVDTSGFGLEDEPALTARQFLKKVKKHKYYGITEQGQFQVLVGEFRA